MRVIHIIPSAFDYFDDIRSAAFATVDELSKIGVDGEAITLQYNAPKREERREIKEVAPSRQYVGTVDFDALFRDAKLFDAVHLHCPLLGAADKILFFKRQEPKMPLVVTYYRDALFSDLISLYIRWYNSHYLPLLFSAADAVVCFSAESFRKSRGSGFLKEPEKLFDLNFALDETEEKRVKLINKEGVARGLAALYNSLILK